MTLVQPLDVDDPATSLAYFTKNWTVPTNTHLSWKPGLETPNTQLLGSGDLFFFQPIHAEKTDSQPPQPFSQRLLTISVFSRTLWWSSLYVMPWSNKLSWVKPVTGSTPRGFAKWRSQWRRRTFMMGNECDGQFGIGQKHVAQSWWRKAFFFFLFPPLRRWLIWDWFEIVFSWLCLMDRKQDWSSPPKKAAIDFITISPAIGARFNIGDAPIVSFI